MTQNEKAAEYRWTMKISDPKCKNKMQYAQFRESRAAFLYRILLWKEVKKNVKV